MLLVGRQEEHPACKKQWWGAGVVICLERVADLHMAQLMPLSLTVSCFSKIQIGFTFLVPAHLGSPGKGPLNRCVCVIFMACLLTNYLHLKFCRWTWVSLFYLSFHPVLVLFRRSTYSVIALSNTVHWSNLWPCILFHFFSIYHRTSNRMGVLLLRQLSNYRKLLEVSLVSMWAVLLNRH